MLVDSWLAEYSRDIECVDPSLIPDSGDNVPIAAVLGRCKVTGAISTAVEDFDRPNHMLNQDTGLALDFVAQFLVFG